MPIVYVPGCPVQPDNFMETLLYLLNQAVGRAPMIPLDATGAAGVAVRSTPSMRGAIGAVLRTGRLRGRVWVTQVYCAAWVLGAGRELQRAQARVDGRDRGCPNVGGICIGCTMPGFPDKFMPFMDMPPGTGLGTPPWSCTGGPCGHCAALLRRR